MKLELKEIELIIQALTEYPTFMKAKIFSERMMTSGNIESIESMLKTYVGTAKESYKEQELVDLIIAKFIIIKNSLVNEQSNEMLQNINKILEDANEADENKNNS